MIKFVNAKINLGLNIVRKREDGYHELETVFFPVGLHNGTPSNPQKFNDILEIHLHHEKDEDEFSFSGNPIDCILEKNLVFKATQAMREALISKNVRMPGVSVRLDKHIPDGAGLGGGSADASFTLSVLNRLTGCRLSKEELIDVALGLGADCPFFIENRPVLATGIGEIMTPVQLNLTGWWAVIVKPQVSISTREAFSGVKPQYPEIGILQILKEPVELWEGLGLKNDFEPHIFERHPEIRHLKNSLQNAGASYAAMSGSGSAVFGLFKDFSKASQAADKEKGYLVKL